MAVGVLFFASHPALDARVGALRRNSVLRMRVVATPNGATIPTRGSGAQSCTCLTFGSRAGAVPSPPALQGLSMK